MNNRITITTNSNIMAGLPVDMSVGIIHPLVSLLAGMVGPCQFSKSYTAGLANTLVFEFAISGLTANLILQRPDESLYIKISALKKHNGHKLIISKELQAENVFGERLLAFILALDNGLDCVLCINYPPVKFTASNQSGFITITIGDAASKIVISNSQNIRNSLSNALVQFSDFISCTPTLIVPKQFPRGDTNSDTKSDTDSNTKSNTESNTD